MQLTGAEAVTLKMVHWALDAASEVHKVSAHNIANAQTPGYTRIDTNFDSFLDALRDVAASDRMDPAAGSEETPVLSLRSTSEAVALDVEMTKLAQNTLYYQALLRGLGKQASILQLAVTEGRR